MSNVLAPLKSGKPRQTVRRRLVPVFAGAGFAGATLKSLTNPAPDADKYHPVVCLESGAVRCDCDDFTYRRARFEPTLLTPINWCKHLVVHIANLQRKKALPPRFLEALETANVVQSHMLQSNVLPSEVRGCSCCGVFGAQYRRAEAEQREQFICADCVSKAKASSTIIKRDLRDEQERFQIAQHGYRLHAPAPLCPACDEPAHLCAHGCRSLSHADLNPFVPDMSAICWTSVNHFGADLDDLIEEQRLDWERDMAFLDYQERIEEQEQIDRGALRCGFSMEQVFGADRFGDTLPRPYTMKNTLLSRNCATHYARLAGMSVDAYIERRKTEKRCCRCQRWKPFSQWNRKQSTYDGLSPYCTDCSPIKKP